MKDYCELIESIFFLFPQNNYNQIVHYPFLQTDLILFSKEKRKNSKKRKEKAIPQARQCLTLFSLFF